MITEDDIHRYYWSVALARPISPINTNPNPTAGPSRPPPSGLIGAGPLPITTTKLKSTPGRKRKKGDGAGAGAGAGLDQAGIVSTLPLSSGLTKHVEAQIQPTSTPAPLPTDTNADRTAKKSKKNKKDKKDRKDRKDKGKNVDGPGLVEEMAEPKLRKEKKKKRKAHAGANERAATANPIEDEHETKKLKKKRKKNHHQTNDPIIPKTKSKSKLPEPESSPSPTQEEKDEAEIDELLPSSPVRIEDDPGFTFSPLASSTPTALMTPHPKSKSNSKCTNKTKIKSGKSKTTPIATSESQSASTVETKSKSKSKSKRKSDSSTFDHSPHDSFSIPDPSHFHHLHPHPHANYEPMSMTTSSRPVGTRVVDKPDSYRLKAIPGHLRAEMRIPRSPIPPSSVTGHESRPQKGVIPDLDTDRSNNTSNGADGKEGSKTGGGSRWPTWATSTPDFLKKKSK